MKGRPSQRVFVDTVTAALSLQDFQDLGSLCRMNVDT